MNMSIAFRTACLLAFTIVVCAQDYRATLLGIVTDASRATVPNAQVKVRNLETGVSITGRTNDGGNYITPYLIPGTYEVKVEAGGFKTFVQSPVELRVNDRVRVDVKLEVGQTNEQITVSSEAPLIESASSNRGEVIDGRAIASLPVNGNNPMNLVGLAAGVQITGELTTVRPFDNGTLSNLSLNGGRSSSNEFQIDGMTNTVMAGRSNNRVDVGYVPPGEATQEFKVQTNTYDAQYGRTGGGIVSVSVKPGTNQYHGAVYEYLRRTPFEANPFGNNAAGQPRPEHSVDQWGFALNGPLTIPKVYKGRDRTFFMFAFEHYHENQPQPGLGSVPTPEQRGGDFSKTFTAANRMFTIYDPFTVTANPDFNPARPVSLTNQQRIRSPFAGNLVPKGRMNSVATRVLQDIPLPNQPGDPVSKLNNWVAGDVATLNNGDNYITRVDHNLNSAWRVYGRWNHSFRDGGIKNAFSWDTPANQATHNFRGNDGALMDVVGTLNATTILTARVGFIRYRIGSSYIPQDVASLGMPQSLLGQLQVKNKYPQFKFENYIQTSTEDQDALASDTITAQANLMKIKGPHSMKFGGEYRIMRYASVGAANVSGTYSFTRGQTSLSPQVDDPNTGNAIASFLLGTMSSGSVNLNATPYLRWHYPVLFFQDDWQVSSRLTLNLGLRWDQEGPPVERYDRQNRGFDAGALSPMQVAGLNLRGGLLFAGTGGQPREAFLTGRNNWQPRAGMAYRIFAARPLVFRAGIGRFFLPTTDFGGSMGYSATTSVISSNDEFLPIRSISNPFPNGLIQPTGSSLGLATGLGQAVAFADPKRRIPYQWSFSGGLQYEVFRGTLLEASYVGSRTRRIQTAKSQNALTAEQLALGTPFLSASQPNPFFGVLPSTTTLGSQTTIARRRLLAPFPQFDDVTQSNFSNGTSWYNALQAKLQQRWRYGISYLISYTWSKTMEAVDYLNPQDAAPSRELVATDTPHRLVISGLYDLPVGPGKRWGNSGAAARIIGGWRMNWVSVFQSGYPIGQSTFNVLGDPKLAGGQTREHWFNTSPSIWVQRASDTLRTSKLRSITVRRHSAPQVDLSVIREFRIAERHRLHFRVSAFNAMNTPLFDSPNTTPSSPLFGVVPNTQRNLPRSFEFGIRYAF